MQEVWPEGEWNVLHLSLVALLWQLGSSTCASYEAKENKTTSIQWNKWINYTNQLYLVSI